MSPLQWKFRLLIMVELRWLPFLFRVTLGTRRFPSWLCELLGVRILVASFARLRRALKLDLCLPQRGYMTRAASDGAMGRNKRECRFGMVEAIYIRPRIGAVACFAAKNSSVWSTTFHAALELAVVWIGMASHASAIRKVKWEDFVLPARGARLVTICAGDRRVAAG